MSRLPVPRIIPAAHEPRAKEGSDENEVANCGRPLGHAPHSFPSTWGRDLHKYDDDQSGPQSGSLRIRVERKPPLTSCGAPTQAKRSSTGPVSRKHSKAMTTIRTQKRSKHLQKSSVGAAIIWRQHFAFTRCGESNLCGIVDAQLSLVEGELLAS